MGRLDRCFATQLVKVTEYICDYFDSNIFSAILSISPDSYGLCTFCSCQTQMGPLEAAMPFSNQISIA